MFLKRGMNSGNLIANALHVQVLLFPAARSRNLTREADCYTILTKKKNDTIGKKKPWLSTCGTGKGTDVCSWEEA